MGRAVIVDTTPPVRYGPPMHPIDRQTSWLRPARPADETRRARVAALAQQVAVEVHRRLGPGVRVYWFGSWVDGRPEPGSDIDLAVEAPQPIPHDRMAELRTWANDLPTLYTVDLLDLGEVGATPRERVLRTGRPL